MFENPLPKDPPNDSLIPNNDPQENSIPNKDPQQEPPQNKEDPPESSFLAPQNEPIELTILSSLKKIEEPMDLIPENNKETLDKHISFLNPDDIPIRPTTQHDIEFEENKENQETLLTEPTPPKKKPPSRLIQKKPIKKTAQKTMENSEENQENLENKEKNAFDFKDDDKTPITRPQANFDDLPIKKSLDVDSIPIGKSSKFEVSEYPPDYNPEENKENTESSNIPLPDRLKSKVWKIRQSAFEELAGLFQTMETNEMLQNFSFSDMAKYIADSNPGAQEKALACFKIYLKKREKIEEDFEELLKILFEKVMVSNKSNIKKTGSEIILEVYLKAQDRKSFVEKFPALFNNKNPKTAATAIATFVEIFQNFGVRKLDFLKPWLQEIEKIATNSNVAGIKQECLSFFKEAYLFLGPDLLKMNTGKLKKAQIEELEKFYSENPFNEPKKPIQSVLEDEDLKFEAKGDNKKNLNKQFDAYEISDPVDIFHKYNEAWTNKVLAFEKWNERKEALEDFLRENSSILKISNNQPSTVSNIQMMLKRLLMDSNVQVTISAIKIIGFLSKGLRRSFYSQAKALLPFLLERLREKKGMLLDETQKTLENMLFSLNLEEVIDFAKETLEGKNVQGKLNGLIWVEKALIKGENLANLKNLMPVFKKLMDDGSNEVRISMMNILGKMAGRVANDKAMYGLIIKEIPEGKLAKFEEIIKKNNEKETIKENNIKENNNKENANKENANKENPKENTKENNNKENPKENNNKESPKENIKEKASNNLTKDNIKDNIKKDIKKKTPVLEDSGYEELTNIPEEEAERILKEKGFEDLLKGLNNPDSKEKQKAIMTFSDYQEAIFLNLEEFLVVLRLKLKNFKDNNLFIMKELFNFLGSQAFLDKIDNKAFNVISNLLLEKANEAKFAEQITQILCKSSKNISIKWLIPNLLNKLTGKANSNVKLISEMLDQFNKLILYVSNPKLNPLKELLAFIKGLITTTNVTIKANLTNILHTLIDLHGKSLILANLGEIPTNFLKNLKLEEEEKKEEEPEETKPEVSNVNIEKTKKNLKEIMEEKAKITNKTAEKKDLLRKEPGLKPPLNKPKEKATPEEKLPKKSDSKANLLTSSEKKPIDFNKLFTKLKHKEWNIRKEGLEELEAFDHNKITNNLIIEILNILKTRLIDPNKPLARQFVVFCGNFCRNLDKETLKPHFKQLLMSLLANLSDKNAGVRLDIINTLKILNNIVGQDISINLISQYYLNNESPEMKSELLKFIRENDLNNEKIEYKYLINPVLSCIIDKNKEIRGNAELLLRKLLEKIGRNVFIQNIRDLKPAQKSQIEGVFEKIAEGMRVETENYEKSLDFEEKKSRKSIEAFSREEILIENSAHKDTLLSINNTNLNNNGILINNSGVMVNNSIEISISKPKDMKIASNVNININPDIENNEESFEELMKKEKGLFLKEITDLHENKITRMAKLEVSKQKDEKNEENSEKNIKKLKIDKKIEVFHCLYNIKSCLEGHNVENCPLQALFGVSKASEWSIFEVFSGLSIGFQELISPFFYQKLYAKNNKENIEFFDGIKFLNKLFQYVLSKENCMALQSLDEISDILIQYMSFILMKSLEFSEELVVLTLESLIFLIKIIRFNCNHLNSIEILFLLTICKVLIEKNLDTNAFIQKTFKTFFLSMICNCKDLQFLQQILLMIFLLSDPNNWNLRYKLLRYLNELVFDYIEPEIEILGNLPEVSSDRETLLRFLNKFTEEDLHKRSNLSKNQLLFCRKSGTSSDPKTQELDNMINETKNSIIRRNTHTQSLFKDAMKNIMENINKNQDFYNENTKDLQLKSNQNSDDKLDKISEDIIKNPIVNQQITSELFLADLKLLEEGNPAQKIDALMFLSDLATSGLTEHGLLFQRHADQILLSFGYVFKKAFSLDMRLSLTERFPLQFLQYFLNMFQKFISAGLFLRFVRKNEFLKEFIEDLLLKMLWEENFISRNFTGVNSGVMLLKLMNILVLRTLEYGDYNGIMEGLMELLYKYRRINANCYKKMYGLTAKCLLKLGLHIGMVKENKQEVEIEKMLELFYRYLSEFYEEEDIGVMTIKEVLFEICKSFGEKVWDFYKKIELKGYKNDYLLEKWISMMMKTVTMNNPSQNETQSLNNEEKKLNEGEMKKLLEKIREKDVYYDENLMKIADIIENNPDMNLETLFIDIGFDKFSSEYIRKALQRLIFIRKCPWKKVAEENKIFHKGVNLTDFVQAESNQNMQNYKFRIKFLNDKYHEVAKLMGSGEGENEKKKINMDSDEPF